MSYHVKKEETPSFLLFVKERYERLPEDPMYPFIPQLMNQWRVVPKKRKEEFKKRALKKKELRKDLDSDNEVKSMDGKKSTTEYFSPSLDYSSKYSLFSFSLRSN